MKHTQRRRAFARTYTPSLQATKWADVCWLALRRRYLCIHMHACRQRMQAARRCPLFVPCLLLLRTSALGAHNMHAWYAPYLQQLTAGKATGAALQARNRSSSELLYMLLVMSYVRTYHCSEKSLAFTSTWRAAATAASAAAVTANATQEPHPPWSLTGLM